MQDRERFCCFGDRRHDHGELEETREDVDVVS